MENNELYYGAPPPSAPQYWKWFISPQTTFYNNNHCQIIISISIFILHSPPIDDLHFIQEIHYLVLRLGSIYMRLCSVLQLWRLQTAGCFQVIHKAGHGRCLMYESPSWFFHFSGSTVRTETRAAYTIGKTLSWIINKNRYPLECVHESFALVSLISPFYRIHFSNPSSLSIHCPVPAIFLILSCSRWWNGIGI